MMLNLDSTVVHDGWKPGVWQWQKKSRDMMSRL